MGNKKIETVYKWRFLPLAVTGIMLVIVLLLKYVFQIEVGKFFGWSIFLTFAGFIYYRGVLEQKKEKEKEKSFDNETGSEDITKNHTLSFEEADNIVEQTIEVADFGGAKPNLTLRKSGNGYLIVECPPFYDGEGNEIDGDKDFPEAMEFENLISEYIGVPVIREDREVFLIEKANIEIIRKVKEFIENYWKLRKGKYKK